MTKINFLLTLRERLKGLPTEDIEKTVDYYNEMIDDAKEEGMTEEEAVASMGNIDEIVSQIVGDTSLTKIVKNKFKPKRKMKAWEIWLLVLGSPLWISLLIAVISIIFSAIAAIFSGVFSILASAIACGVSGIVTGIYEIIVLIVKGYTASRLAALGIALISLSLFFPLWAFGIWVTKLLIKLCKTIVNSIKKHIMGKENQNEEI